MSYAELSEDDDSFVLNDETEEKTLPLNSISISSDDENRGPAVVYELTSDEEEPSNTVELRKKKQELIKNLFPNTKPNIERKAQVAPEIPKPQGFEQMIGGIKVHIPVKPYGCQTALMFKVITAINKSQNCLLESPTGSGKTLALLCGALAWVRHENNRISEQLAQELVSQNAELKQVTAAAGYVSTPVRDKSITPEKYFNKPVFGQKSIYDEASQCPKDASNRASKRQDCPDTSTEENNEAGLVKIHKKRRLGASELGMFCESLYDSQLPSTLAGTELPSTPEKKKQTPQPDTPQNVRVPTIYYGARTHKQLQQVIKEFARTDYCGQLQMTVLSSRDYSCVREFDKKTWSTRNDMCRACVKPYTTKSIEQRADSNCKYYDNRGSLNHQTLPPAFDLDELIAKGEEIRACPYYAARGMAASAHIVFCPYNYLIEPSIRSSMQIDLSDNIVIIDEAHNIEDICRDAATFTFTRDNVQASIKELEVVAGYRFANQDALRYVEFLLRAFKGWDDWFVNQTPFINQKPMTGNEAVFTWAAENFVQTLNNHNIGQQQYKDFHQNAELFCKRFREDPRTLLGVTQTTATLVENMDTVLGYLFRCEGKYMDDFTPALVRTVTGPDSFSWRQSQFNKSIEKETLSLRLLCMNPAVVFESLKVARCIILASGTLTPLISLHSELGTDFPLQVSPNHVIPPDRVWIGSLSTCPGGGRLECSARGAGETRVQDGVGAALRCVCRVTPHGVLCFLPSYTLMNKLVNRWKETGLWGELNELKQVFMEARNARDHSDVMEEYYSSVCGGRGALLLAVYRGKVSEGMDFRDHQARAVVTVGVPYPNTYDMAVKEKMKYNDRYSAQRHLLSSSDWLLVQAYRALNQAVGRCVRHRGDWGGVLLVDARFSSPHYTQHLSKWVRNFLGNNHHTFESLVNSPNSLESFMQTMTLRESEDI
ncbi:Fanconi anemia group J protein homolog isoform X2 [Papilio machaon]|uniref:Fanconi anemia group J protein homolog isoform X2 n=1 Tax=Papilio machaon TaxID=76193 RepID=UPI001E666058|nr:Fanconi anemia group J protein homolog isoform X2 [Papilio machaon]